MKKLFFALLALPQLSMAVSKINCEVVERYNDRTFTGNIRIETNDESAIVIRPSERDANLKFVAYYSKEQNVVGARVIDENLGTHSGNFIDPKLEKASVKVRYIKSKPEAQLFAIDCVVK